MRKAGFIVYAYLDDYAGCCATQEEAEQAYRHFIHLTCYLDLQLAQEKCQPLAQNVTWLGYTVDTVNMNLSIPTEKIQELRNICNSWMTKEKANKKMLQSLIRKILHTSGCIRHVQKFTARLLMALRSMGQRQ